MKRTGTMPRKARSKSGFESSNVAGFEYDRKAGELVVTFHSGYVYRYSVPVSVYEEMQTTPSKANLFILYCPSTRSQRKRCERDADHLPT